MFSSASHPGAQAHFNLDTMDGTGPSGVPLDLTKSQIFVIDYEWLGVGRVRFGFVFAGAIVYCHDAVFANTVGSVYMSTPNNPLRYQTEATGGSPPAEGEIEGMSAFKDFIDTRDLDDIGDTGKDS